jgi:type III secretion system YscQ/HrcQ family protein
LKTAEDRLNLEGQRTQARTSGDWKGQGRTPLSHETLSTIEWGEDSRLALGAQVAPEPEGGPFDWIPRLSSRQVRLERWLAGWSQEGRSPPALEWLEVGCGGAVALDRPEVFSRASGLNRPGMIAQLTVPRLATRLAIGIENALAHAVVDRLLGFDREFAETRLQLTPVEWGIWTFLILRALDGMDSRSDAGQPLDSDEGLPFGPGDLRLDRAGPDPFDPSGLGSIVTVRWGVRIGTVSGSVRLWLPEFLVRQWAESPDSSIAGGTAIGGEIAIAGRAVPRDELSSTWRAEAGSVAMPQGLRRLRVGGVLPLSESRWIGTPASPDGPVDLILDLEGSAGRFRIPARPVPESGGRLVRAEDGPRREPRPRDPILVPVRENRTMSESPSPTGPSSPTPEASPLDVPVTLTVELGRVNLTLSRLADLKPGDVVELSRHSRAPVELTSNGRLVARGELILIDTDLGVRVTSVFL